MSGVLSVVMAAYNHAEFVGEAIESALGQSFGDFEFIITDDGSSDGTAEVIRRYRDPRIKFEIFPANRGAVHCLNSAIRRARGEFVAVLNSDDFFLPGKLERQVRFLREHPQVAAVFGLPRCVDESSRPLPFLRVFAIPFAEPEPTRLQWLRHFFFHGNCLCHPSVMIRRSAYDEVGLLDPRLWNLPDFDLWVRLCMRHEIRVLPEELTAFRILAGHRNTSAPRPETIRRTWIESFQILKHYRKLDADTAREIFAADIAKGAIATDRPFLEWLAELAAGASGPFHALFSLDTLHEALQGSEATRRLIELTGRLDCFGRLPPHLGEPAAAPPARDPALPATGAPAGPPPHRNSPCPCGSGKRFKHCHGAHS